MPNRNVSIVSTLKDWTSKQFRSINTASMAIVEDVDTDDYRVEVSLKTDPEVFIDDVPVVSPYVMDGAGMVFPVEEEMEGLLLHTKEDLQDAIVESGHVELETERRFQLESAVFVGGVWNGDMEVPEHEDGEMVISMPDDGSVLRMVPDGEVRIEHQSGNVIQMSPDGTITLGTPGSAAAVLTENAVLEDSEGETVSIIDPGSEHTEAS